MKILSLMAIPTLTGAAAPARDRLLLLREAGAEITVGLDRVRPDNLEGLLEQDGFPIIKDLGLSTITAPWVHVMDLLRLTRLMKKQTVDLIECHLSHDHLMAVLARRFSGCRIPILRHLHAQRSLEKRLGQAWLWQQTQGAILSTEAHRDALIHGFSMNPNRLLVQGGVVDTTRFHPPSPDEQGKARHHFGLEDHHRVLLHVARLKPGRNLVELLRAFIHAARENKNLTLLLVGDGEQKAELERIAQDNLDSNQVRFTGYLGEELPMAYHAADAYLQAEVGNDATCRAILEASASALPVWAADHITVLPDLPENILAGRFAIHDPMSRNGTMMELCQTPSIHLQRLGRLSHQALLQSQRRNTQPGRIFSFYQSFLPSFWPV